MKFTNRPLFLKIIFAITIAIILFISSVSYKHIRALHDSNEIVEHTYRVLIKIEHAKNLIIKDNLTLTEVAYRLNYSSVAHLSTQFKNITGITPSQFQRIITKRREIANKK